MIIKVINNKTPSTAGVREDKVTAAKRAIADGSVFSETAIEVATRRLSGTLAPTRKAR